MHLICCRTIAGVLQGGSVWSTPTTRPITACSETPVTCRASPSSGCLRFRNGLAPWRDSLRCGRVLLARHMGAGRPRRQPGNGDAAVHRPAANRCGGQRFGRGPRSQPPSTPKALPAAPAPRRRRPPQPATRFRSSPTMPSGRQGRRSRRPSPSAPAPTHTQIRSDQTWT